MPVPIWCSYLSRCCVCIIGTQANWLHSTESVTLSETSSWGVDMGLFDQAPEPTPLRITPEQVKTTMVGPLRPFRWPYHQTMSIFAGYQIIGSTWINNTGTILRKKEEYGSSTERKISIVFRRRRCKHGTHGDRGGSPLEGYPLLFTVLEDKENGRVIRRRIDQRSVGS